MTKVDPKKPVMLTGATGYIAGWIVKKLLADGKTVHAAVRDPENESKVGHLKKMAVESAGEIHFFKANLLEENSYFKAMQGCELVIHTASPFFIKVKNPQTDLIDPALKGTQNILNSVNKTQSVKRVVLTSSVAAIYGDNIDAKNAPNHTLNEDTWNASSSLEHNPYSYSKTLAEREAWKVCEAQARWDLVTINPSFVMGPATNAQANFESKNFMVQMTDGTFRMGAPDLQLCVVDVREVAQAHITAGFRPEVSGRHILSAQSLSLLQMGEILRYKFGRKYPFPKSITPRFLVWLFAPLAGFSRRYVTDNIGYAINFDRSKSEKELHTNYRSVELSLQEFFQQLLDENIIKKR